MTTTFLIALCKAAQLASPLAGIRVKNAIFDTNDDKPTIHNYEISSTVKLAEADPAAAIYQYHGKS